MLLITSTHAIMLTLECHSVCSGNGNYGYTAGGLGCKHGHNNNWGGYAAYDMISVYCSGTEIYDPIIWCKPSGESILTSIPTVWVDITEW